MTDNVNFELIDELAADGGFMILCEEYVNHCAAKDGRLPNMAGFFRWLRFDAAALDHLKREHGVVYRTLLMTFEDEAINSQRSPSLISAYLKQYFKEGDRDEEQRESPCGPITLVFDHDVNADGE